jgi:hypothetical protein
MARLIKILLYAALCLWLAACEPAALTPSPTAEATPPAAEATAELTAEATALTAPGPTFTALMAASATPAAQTTQTAADPTATIVFAAITAAPPRLDQTFSDVDMLGAALTVAYPAGWSHNGDPNNLLLTNHPPLLADIGLDLMEDQVGVSITVSPLELVPEADRSPALFLASYLNTLAQQQNNGLSMGQILLTTVGDRAAAAAFGSASDDDAMALVVDVGGAYALLVSAADRGRMEFLQPFVLEIAAAMTYTR